MEYDAETGLYYLNSRYYDPEIGRFINADDISMLGANGEFASLNLYVYCGNNPVIREDKGGKFWNIVAGAVIGAVISTTIQIVTNVATGKEWHEGALLAFAGGAITGGLAATGAPILVQAAVSSVVSASTDLINQYTDEDFEQVDWVQVGVAGGAGFVSGLIGGNGIQHKSGSLSHAKGIYKYTVDNIKNRAWSASKANTYLNLASKNLQKVWTKELLITTGRYVGGAAVATAAQQGFSYLKEL